MFTIYDLASQVNIDGYVRLRIFKEDLEIKDTYEIFSKDYDSIFDLGDDVSKESIVRYAYENFELDYVFASNDGYLTLDTILPADFPDKRALANLGENKLLKESISKSTAKKLGNMICDDIEYMTDEIVTCEVISAEVVETEADVECVQIKVSANGINDYEDKDNILYWFEYENTEIEIGNKSYTIFGVEVNDSNIDNNTAEYEFTLVDSEDMY